MPRNPNKTPCSVPGCRAWAIRGSDPPRCSPHRHLTPHAPVVPVLSGAEGSVAEPSPSTPHASPEAHPDPAEEPLEGPADEEAAPRVGAPAGNQNRLVHGFYAKILHPNERADLVAYAADTTLEAEIAITRVALRRILGMLLTGLTAGPNPAPLTAGDYARYAALAFHGAGTVSRLLRAHKTLTGDKEPGWPASLEQALDELSEEWGVDL